MVRFVFEIAVQNRDKIIDAFFVGFAERLRNNRERVGNAVTAGVIRHFGQRVQRRERAVLFAVVHRVRTGRKRLAFFTAVGRAAGLFAVNHIGGNRQRRQRMNRAAVSRGFAKLGNGAFQKRARNEVYAVVVIAVGRELADGFKIDNIAVFVTNRVHLGVLNCGKAVRRNGKAGDAERHKARDVCVVQRHLDFFIGVFVVHIVNDVHGVDVQSAKPGKIDREAAGDFGIVEGFTFYGIHLRADAHFAHIVIAAVNRKQQKFSEVAACAEELHLFADLHRGNAAGNGVIVAVNRAH